MGPSDSNMNRGNNDPMNPIYNFHIKKDLRYKIRELVCCHANADILLRESEEIVETVYNKIISTWNID